jgi:UDP-N-acetylmuramate--alanine ligase
VTYGFSAAADLRADNVTTSGGVTTFDALVLERSGERRRIAGVTLPMPGRHNVQNALAAIAVGLELGLADEVIARGFERFGGVKRRFTRVGEVDGAVIIDDYAHHPVEIRAVLSAARDSTSGRVIAVVQPHRFTRLRDLMEDFANAFVEADAVLVAPVYAAGESPIEGVDHVALADAIRSHGHRMVQPVNGPEDVAHVLRDLAADGDLVVCMGAGDITKWAAGLAEAIRTERANKG